MDLNGTSHYGSGTGSSTNAINVTGSPVAPSHAVGRPPSSRRSSDVNSPSSSSRDHIPLNHRIESSSSTSHAQAPVAGVNTAVSSDTSQTAPRFQIDSPSSLTAYDESADVLSMSPLPKATVEQVQNRLGSFLATLNTLSVSFPHLSKPAAVVPLSAASHALHHAQHTAHVAVKGSNASFDIAQTMHTLAHHSHEAAARALDLAQQSLAAAQAAFAAAEQSSASAQAALVGCREARERANEAVDAVQRVTAVLDAHEQSIAGWEEQVQKMAIETRSAVEELRSWATDLEQDGVRGRARRRISWETDEGKRADKQQHETSERRTSLATDASRWQVAEVVRDMESQPAGRHRRTLSIPIFGAPQVAGQIAVIESAHRVQQESRHIVPGHTTSIETQGVTSSTATPATRTETRAQEASRKYQQKRYQATTKEQERARAATEPKLRAERTGQIARNGDAIAGEVPHGIPPDAFPVTEGGPVSLPTSHVASEAPPAPQRQSYSQAASLGPATTDTSGVLRNRFIPATTEAGRFLQNDLPFSSVTRTSGNNIDCGDHAENPIFVSDSSPWPELPSDNALDTRPVNGIPSDTSKPANALTVANEGTPANSLPTWTTLKREPSRDTYEGDTGNPANNTLAEHPIALRSTPLLTPHVERLTTLRRVADASGIHPSPNLNHKIKQEPSSSDALLPLRKTNRVGHFPAPVPRFDRTQDANSAFPQRPPPRSVSPGDSTGNRPIQVGVTPPRMKKVNRAKFTTQEPLANDRHAADKGDSGVTNAEHPSVGDNTRQIHSNGVDDSYPQTSRSDRDSKTDADTGDRHIPEQRPALNGRPRDDNGGDTRVPRERRLSDNRVEYLGKDGGFRGQKFDGYATRDRGNDRSWGAPKSFISGRSPSPRQWDNSPPRRPSIRRDTYQGNTVVSPDSRSSPSLPRFSRPIIRRRYSPSSSPVSYGRSQPPPRPLAPPTSPQIGPRKRLRESTGFMPSSEVAPVWRTWNDDSDTRRSGPGPWQASSDFSSPIVSRRTPSVSRTLASRMQEPAPHPLPPSDTGPNDNHHVNPNPTRGDAAGTDVEDTATGPRAEHRVHSRQNSFSDKVRDYERDDLGPSSVLGKRKKFREMEGSEFPAELDGDRPYLLSRMSDQTRSPFRGFGSSIRGYSSSGRGYERGRGFGRGRGAPFSRGGYRGRMKPLQDRIH